MKYSYIKHLKKLVFVLILLITSLSFNAKSINYSAFKLDNPHEQLLKLISMYANYGMPKAEFMEKVEELIKKGANPNAHVKTITHTRKIGSRIFNYKKDYWSSTTYTTPFHVAVLKKNIPLVKKLVELGANPDLPDKKNIHPIDLALEKRDTSMVFCLLDLGANIKRIRMDYYLDAETVKRLIKRGANPNSVSKSNKWLINRFVERGDSETVLFLLGHGADINKIDLSNCPSLELSETLVKRGANHKSININLAFNGKNELKRVLALKPDFNNAKLDFLLAFRKSDILFELIDNGISINIKERSFNHPLIFGAVKYGKVSDIEKLLQKGASLSTKHKSETLIEYAIANGRSDMAAYLLKKTTNKHSKEPLIILAAENKNVDAIELLIKMGEHVDRKNKYGKTALIIAVEKGDISSVEVLTKNGANANYKAPGGTTPLVSAIELNKHFNKDKFAIIKQLVESEAKINAKYKGKSIIDYAVSRKCYWKIIEYLKKPDENTIPVFDFDGDFSEYDLSRIKDTRRLERYVKWGANPKTIKVNYFLDGTLQLKKVLALKPDINPDKLDFSEALESGSLSILVKKGFNINSAKRGAYSFKSFMDLAINNSDTILINQLVLAGWDINKMNTLKEAIRKENPFIVEFLLQNGADANGEDIIGRLHLTEAVKEGNYEIIELLILHGADPLKNFDNDKSPIIYALKDSSYINALELFIDYNTGVDVTDKKGKSLLEYAIEFDNTKAVRLLLGKGANLGNDKAMTPIYRAFLKDNSEIIDLLIKAGTKLNVEFYSKERLLIKALNEKRKKAAIALIKYGADVNYKPKQGKRPLFTAIKIKDLELIKLLIENGAKTNIRDNFRKPYDYAKLIGCSKEILDYLKQFD